jgi:hypothetical protein
LAGQSRKLDHIIIVIEGNTSQTTRYVNEYGFDTIEAAHEFQGFSAGANRDIGIKHAERLYGRSHFVFIDGDCVPSVHFAAHHYEALQKYDATFGLRIDRTSHRIDGAYGRFIDRRVESIRMKPIFIRGEDVAYNRIDMVRNNHVCWSCNMGLSANSIDFLREINNQLPCPDDRVFSQVFDGLYGGEDAFVGLTLMRFDRSICMLDPLRSSIDHIQHQLQPGTRVNFTKVAWFDDNFLIPLSRK